MISYNEKHFTEDGAPFFPIMGEYEYSRTERREWKRGIAKMKALGINTVQCYCIWLHHEEIKGHYNFRESNNLRAFVRLVGEADMKMCLRIGPWVHAELRNGGFPDWIFEEGYKPRSNDPRYLADVRAYFTELYKQCKGYLPEDGGPIFSLQIENEFRHHTAGSYEEGVLHFKKLTEILNEIGFCVPIHFATGWGNAITGEAIPTWGDYAAQPWEQNTLELPTNAAYLIGRNPNEAPIGEYVERPTALGKNQGAKTRVPYISIEQGAGNQPTKTRRPIVTGEDNAAMLLCALAQGMVGIGYYVFHGGINPMGALSSTQEYRNTEYMKTRDGYFCDLAERNYDFQGAVSMYNRITENGKELKIWNTFAAEFSSLLCGGEFSPLSDNAKDKDDFDSHRYSIMRHGGTGFLFYNNYVRRRTTPKKLLSGFTFESTDLSISFPDVEIDSGEYAIFPFNLPFGSSTLKYATATPLCILNNTDIVLFNKCGKAKFEFSGCGKVLVLTKRDAQNAFKVTLDGKEHLIITDGEIYSEDGKLLLECTDAPTLKIYPAPTKLDGFECSGNDGELAIFKKAIAPAANSDKTKVSFKKTLETEEYTDYTVTVDYRESRPDEVYVGFNFSADLAEIIIDGEKVNDMFYTGTPFEVSMRYYDFPKELTLRLYPLAKSADVYLERTPIYDERGIACSLTSVTAEDIFKTELEIAKYKNYQEVLQAKDYLSAMKEYLKDKGMTLEEFAGTEEAMEARAKAAKWRFTSPEPFLPIKNDSTKK